jgi:hypothetical protein
MVIRRYAILAIRSLLFPVTSLTTERGMSDGTAVSSTTLPCAARLPIRASRHTGYGLKNLFDDQFWHGNQGCVIDPFRSASPFRQGIRAVALPSRSIWALPFGVLR